MWPVWSGFQFGMCLGSNEPGVFRYLYHLNDSSVRGQAGEHHAMLCKSVTVVVIYFIAVPVAFFDFFCSI